jgi:ABC-type lipoprotein release transport system permease subunit
MASVFFAAFFCILLMSFNLGTWETMIDNSLRTQTGHIQIHGKGYWDDMVIDNFMFMDAVTLSQIEHISGVENVSPRVETFAMASNGTVNKGIAVIGVSPDKEVQKSNLSSRLVMGEYLLENDNGVLIGEGLSKYLGVSLGDTLALIGQGYHGTSAAGLFPIRGILKLITIEMDNGMIYMTLPTAQHFIDMPDGYSGILISIRDNKLLDETIQNVEQIVDTQTLDVYSWHFTMERMLQTAESDKAFSFLLMYVLYIIVGFGILSTIIMMTNERRREFCMMISLGMPRLRLSTIICVELMVMSLIGLILSITVTLPITHWFALHPIKISGELANTFHQFGMQPFLPMSVEPHIYTDQIITILAISLLAVIYPVNKVLKLKLNKKN